MTTARALTRKQAARMGKAIEFRLMRILESQGYEVSRSDLSRFPDLHYWDCVSHFYAEVKYCTNRARGVSDAKTAFKKAVKERRFFPEGCPVQLWVFVGEDEEWSRWDWVDGELITKPGLRNGA